ncbi:hypothetical protein NB037_15730 [Rathayibacter sp. ZW T2_19]|uniref:Uncharacterized protein n=1 Tax=Rathayibacter rubneri TaxID=2950106 RepID=A0A9X2DZJ4_9MICO|nr:hypothetical protein [Rathayibacter rubneri]MCM6763867.1 hypothetical protein [Rathayibacter rubneri]
MSIRRTEQTGSIRPRTVSLIAGGLAPAQPLRLQFERRPDGGTWNDQISSVTVY